MPTFTYYKNKVVKSLRGQYPPGSNKLKGKTPKQIERIVKKEWDTLKKTSTDIVSVEQCESGYPDLIITMSGNIKYGMEIKSSESTKSGQWTVPGNSVIGSRREKGLKKIYILFVAGTNGGGNYPDFRCKEEEKCIADISITHSPRFEIDMNLGKGKDLGRLVEYQKAFKNTSLSELIDNPTGHIVELRRFLSQKKNPEWYPHKKQFSKLPESEKIRLKAEGLIRYPSVVASDYELLKDWLSEHKNVDGFTRDWYSAGGLSDIDGANTYSGYSYKGMPKVFKHINDLRAIINEILDSTSDNELRKLWNTRKAMSTLTDKQKVWAKCVAKFYKNSYTTTTAKIPKGIKFERFILDIIQKQ